MDAIGQRSRSRQAHRGEQCALLGVGGVCGYARRRRRDGFSVLEIMVAVSLLAVPMTAAAFFPQSPWAKLAKLEQRGDWVYEVFYAGLIIFFCFISASLSWLSFHLRRPFLCKSENTSRTILNVARIPRCSRSDWIRGIRSFSNCGAISPNFFV